jgi:hypothetical protein
MSDLESIQSCPIKVTYPVPKYTRTDEKAIENTKTGKVTVVVMVMQFFGETKHNPPNAKAKLVLQRPN